MVKLDSILKQPFLIKNKSFTLNFYLYPHLKTPTSSNTCCYRVIHSQCPSLNQKQRSHSIHPPVWFSHTLISSWHTSNPSALFTRPDLKYDVWRSSPLCSFIQSKRERERKRIRGTGIMIECFWFRGGVCKFRGTKQPADVSL